MSPLSDFVKPKVVSAEEPKVEEQPKVEEAVAEVAPTAELTPLQKMYAVLHDIQNGRDLSEIPLNDPYYKYRDEIHVAEYEVSRSK